VVSSSSTVATVTLAYNGTDFDADVTTMNVTIAAAELSTAAILTSKNLTVSAYNETITITGNPVTLTAFPSSDPWVHRGLQKVTYTISATQLSGSLVITAPTGFVVSKTTATGFAGSVSYTLNASGTVASTTVYVRFQPTAIGATGNLNITNVSTKATTLNVIVSGTGAAATTSTVTATSGYTYTGNIAYGSYQTATGLTTANSGRCNGFNP
jgi:hypothetical protein